MRLEAQVITPLHIGSGEEISPIEYIIKDRVIRVQMDDLFKDESFNAEEFIQNAKKNIYLGDYSKLGLKYPRYEIEIDKNTRKNLLSSVKTPSAGIREFIRTADRPFIPGSSIKGAIKTAVLWKMLQDDKLQKKAEKYLIKSRGDSRFADKEVQKLTFGEDPRSDLFKSLQVYDSAPLSNKDLKINEVKTLTSLKNGFGWKKFLTFVEALRTGVEFEYKVKKDNFFLNEPELGFSENRWLLDQLPDICNEFSKEFINAEIDFFDSIGFNEIKEFYLNLKKDAEKNDGFLLHLAWGSGWHGMTVGRILQHLSGCFDERCRSKGVCSFHNTVFCNLRRNYRLGEKRRKNKPSLYVKEFPKTRKIAFEDGKPVPLGWVKVNEQDF